MTDQLLDRAAVAALVGIHPDSISRYLARGGFPPPDARFGRSPAWREQTIRDWLAARPGQGVGGGRPRKNG